MTTAFRSTGNAATDIAQYLEILTARTGLALHFDIQVPETHAREDREVHENRPASAQPAENAASEAPAPTVTVEFTGPDTPLLLARNGELLHAIEHVAAKILRLEPEEHDRISFDAEGFKAGRTTELTRAAELAIQTVRTTGRPWSFAPMTSRERRMLHLILSASGLPTASSGMGPRRFVVLYPEGFTIPPEADPGSSLRQPRSAPPSAERAEAIRNRFRRR